MHRLLLLGHRGAPRVARENTMGSFDAALEHGCDGFEFDVRLTIDGGAVVCHGSRFKGRTIAKTATTKLDGLPLFANVLKEYGSHAWLDIELKVSGLETQIISALKATPMSRGYVVSSFLPEVLITLRKLNRSIPLGLICDNRKSLARWREMNLDYIIPKQSLVTRQLVSEIHAAGKKIMVWTVNRSSTMLRFSQWGVDGIISDKTRLLVQTVAP